MEKEFLKLKKSLEELKWMTEIRALALDKKEFYKKFIEREEYDKLLSQWEDAVAEAKYYKKKAQQLQAENYYLKKKVAFLKTLLSEAKETINTLEEKMVKQAIEIFKSIKKSINCGAEKKIEKIEKKFTAPQKKSELRKLIEQALKKNLNEVSNDVDTSKDYTFSAKV